MRRVVITGMGAVTPLGTGVGECLAALMEGRSGVGPITGFDASGLDWRVAGEARGFDPLRFVSAKEVLRLDPFVQYAVAAAEMALSDSGLSAGLRAGVLIGSSRGGVTTLERAALAPRPSAYTMPASTVGMAASHLARRFGLRGHSFGVSSACASGAHAVGEAMRLIGAGHEEVMLAGGAEAPITRLCMQGYGGAGALAKEVSAWASRPFDAGRRGFVLSEGAAVLVLEEMERAVRRGARIYGEIAGYGNAINCVHETKPNAEGEIEAMQKALRAAGAAAPDLIMAHGTGTLLGDRVEAGAIKEIADGVRVVAVKSLTGHMLSASGPFDAICAVLCMREGMVPPYPHLENNESGLNIAGKGARGEFRTAMVNSFGFGGFCASLVIKGMR